MASVPPHTFNPTMTLQIPVSLAGFLSFFHPGIEPALHLIQDRYGSNGLT